MSDVKPHLILREKWLTALESGKYAQRFGNLYGPYSFPNTEPSAVCALGVAGLMIGKGEEQSYYPYYPIIHDKLKLKTFKNSSWTIEMAGDIIEMNDSKRLSFPQIAAEIRKNPSKYFLDE